MTEYYTKIAIHHLIGTIRPQRNTGDDFFVKMSKGQDGDFREKRKRKREKRKNTKAKI